jgi:hypothetical protein
LSHLRIVPDLPVELRSIGTLPFGGFLSQFLSHLGSCRRCRLARS